MLDVLLHQILNTQKLKTLGKKEKRRGKGEEPLRFPNSQKILSKFTMSSLQVLFEIKVFNVIFKNE
jgi:hypothetical protein